MGRPVLNRLLSRLLPKDTPEDFMLRTVRRKVPRIRNIIEAGAHNGSDSVRLAKAFPKATIHAFECYPAHFKSLETRTVHNKNIRAYESALAPSDGKLQFHVSSGASDASGSILEPDEHKVVHPSVLFNESIIVNATTIDSWLESNPGLVLDFAWLDMQGAEQSTLGASPKALGQLRAIYTEVSFRQMYSGAPLYSEFRTMLEQLGFELEIEDRRWEDMGNALFLKRMS